MLAPSPSPVAVQLRGILLMTGAMFAFACLDTVAKVLGATMPSAEISWVRYVGHVLLLCLVFRVWRDPSPFRTRKPLLQIVRGLLLLGSTFFNFWALQYLQLAEASAIMFAGPLVVTALAGPVLGEKVGVRRWIAVLVGFAGVLVVTRPGTGAMHWAALLSVCAMVSNAGYNLMTKRLHATENTKSLVLLSALVGVVVLAPVAPSAVGSLDGWWMWTLAALMGAFGLAGHLALVEAHRIASASSLAPFTYTEMIWMIAFGYAVFTDVPDVWTIVGTLIITGSGLYIFHRERVRGQEVAARTPAATP